MDINDDQEKIYFNGLIFYKINYKWWRVIEKAETFNSTTPITCIVPDIIEEIEGGVLEIKQRYMRSEKLKRIIDE